MSKRGPSTQSIHAPSSKVRKFNLRDELIKDELIKSVTLLGNEVTLELHPLQNTPDNCKSIRNALIHLNSYAKGFNHLFNKPQENSETPTFTLKDNHGFQSGQEVLAAIKSFATAQRQPIRIKKALRQDKLFSGATLEDNVVTFELAEAYKSANYLPIMQGIDHLYSQSENFKNKFEKPKRNNSSLSLRLKPNHGYQNGQQVIAVLKEFADNDKVLKIKDAIYRDKLFSDAKLENNTVTFTLHDNYDSTTYVAINKCLHTLHATCDEFQAKSMPPLQGNKSPVLTLKPGHGYENSQDVLAALKAFTAPKPRIQYRQLMQQGKLFSKAILKGRQIILELAKKEYNYQSVNIALHALYPQSKEFQAKFERPKKSNLNKPVTLTLKLDCSYQSGEEVLAALTNFADNDNLLKIKDALRQDNLFSDANIDNSTVTFTVHPDYTSDNEAINQCLRALHSESTAFHEKFDLLSQRASTPMLTLKAGHGYQNGQDVLKALKSFAALQHCTPIREAISQEKLFAGATIDGNLVTFEMADTYKSVKYESIMLSIAHLHSQSEDFQAQFEKPKRTANPPSLTLKSNKDYQTGQAVITALKNFANKGIGKISIKAAIRQDKLFSDAQINNNRVTFTLHDDFNRSKNYKAINKCLHTLHTTSEEFQAKFEIPSHSASAPVLTLKPEHGYENGQDVLKALKNFAAPQPKIQYRQLIQQGKLFTNATYDNKGHVILELAPNYRIRYQSINRALFDLYPLSKEFQERFEQPKKSNVKKPVTLTLKPNQTFQNSEVTLEQLKKFATVQIPAKEQTSTLNTTQTQTTHSTHHESPAITQPPLVNLAMLPLYERVTSQAKQSNVHYDSLGVTSFLRGDLTPEMAPQNATRSHKP